VCLAFFCIGGGKEKNLVVLFEVGAQRARLKLSGRVCDGVADCQRGGSAWLRWMHTVMMRSTSEYPNVWLESFFAAGPPQGKKRPLGGQQAEGAAWGPFLFVTDAKPTACRSRSLLLGAPVGAQQ